MTVRVLAYEARRLSGLRSTWIVLATVLLCDAAVAALLARQVPPGTLAVAAAVRSVTAAVPLLPLPIAAIGAGVLGALSYGHEVRHPGLAASQVGYLRRVRLLFGKVVVVGALSALLAAVTVLADAVVTRLALGPAVDASQVFARGALSSGGRLPVALAVFAVLVVAAGGAGVLTASLTRSASAGILLLCALPVLLEAGLALFLRQTGTARADAADEVLPLQYGFDWVRAGSGPAVGGPLDLADPALLAVLASPAVLLVLVCLVAQLRRRAL
ncbi:hypothetical protein [Streptomyces sp. CB03911]|uniref:hypothetical protein n=1 Tax=Streptomyces sp. CB03911 TaxID=1804758 RepID=UPI00093D0A26|nr:hypothetical protein [Streptomyces sp. CB03911]OKI23084.1 hypothetical protein A6A07_32835 [Streptomyces sp. CB03911]